TTTSEETTTSVETTTSEESTTSEETTTSVTPANGDSAKPKKSNSILPNTGSSSSIAILIAGLAVFASTIFLKRRK
ncbi:TPA: LPXTG cell wall anchor domain-containing protein, partial [Streptococcus suis]